MPLTSPACPPGLCRFVDREFLAITYRTHPAKFRALMPEERTPDGDTVKYETIRMPDSMGFGDYIDTRQVIPVTFCGRKGGCMHCMFLNDDLPFGDGLDKLVHNYLQ